MAAKPLPVEGFAHGRTPNGILVSTCLRCSKVAGSPKAENLELAERSHRCAACPVRKTPGPIVVPPKEETDS